MKKKSSCPSDELIVVPAFRIARDVCEKPGHALDDLFPSDTEIVVKDLRKDGGDYSVVGLENYVAIERKSLADLLQTLWGKSQLADGSWQPNLGRFAYELSKLAERHFAYVAIEGTRDALAQRIAWRARECRKYHKVQRITYEKTLGLVSSLQAEFGVSFCFFRDRIEMANAIYADLYHCWRRANGLSKSKLGDYTPSGVNKAVQEPDGEANSAPSASTFDAETPKMV